MSEVKEAAERLVYVLGQSGPLEHIEYVRGALCDNAELVAKDWLRLSAEVGRLRELCEELKTAGKPMRVCIEHDIGQLACLSAWDAVVAKLAEEEPNVKTVTVWVITFNQCEKRLYTDYHAEQYCRALRLNGTPFTMRIEKERA